MDNKPATISILFALLGLLFLHIHYCIILAAICSIIGAVCGFGGLTQGVIIKKERVMALVGFALSMYIVSCLM